MSIHDNTGRPKGATTKARRDIKIPLIVRWTVAGRSNVEIGELLQMSPTAIAHIKNSPEYKTVESNYISGHIQKLDAELDVHAEAIRIEARNAVPVAVQGLIEVAKQRKDLKAALAAQIELLNRDPDRVLSDSSVSSDADNKMSPTIPDSVLEGIVTAGNATASTYNTPTEKVN